MTNVAKQEIMDIVGKLEGTSSVSAYERQVLRDAIVDYLFGIPLDVSREDAKHIEPSHEEICEQALSRGDGANIISLRNNLSLEHREYNIPPADRVLLKEILDHWIDGGTFEQRLEKKFGIKLETSTATGRSEEQEETT